MRSEVPIRWTSGTDVVYYNYNAHGDVVQLTNSSGTVFKSYTYDAFGNEINRDEADQNPFRYCGEYYDKETGTYYLRARYYNPTNGRFTQQDTHWNPFNQIYGDGPLKINERQDALGLNYYSYAPDITAILQSGNLYVYTVNNPVLYRDPTGRVLINVLFAAIGAVGGWMFGDYVAKNLGLDGWKYWAVRSAVTVGGAAIGWFAGGVLAKVAAAFLKANPEVMFKLASSMGSSLYVTSMKFMGINPFTAVEDAGKFNAVIKFIFNTPKITVGLDWAKTIIQKAQQFGYSVRLDAGHAGTAWADTWHLNIGKLHVALDPKIIGEIKKLLGG